MTDVLIAASSAVVRAGLESIVSASPALRVIGSVPGLGGLAEQLAHLQPDVILLDMERGVGADRPALLSVNSEEGSPAVVVLTAEGEGSAVADVLRHGAVAVLPRDAQPAEIVGALEAAAAGLVVLHPQSADALLAALPSIGHSTDDVGVEQLTAREIEVLAMLAEGEGNKSIARRMGISEHTVKFHVGSILGKLRAASRTEAVTIGVRRGLIML